MPRYVYSTGEDSIVCFLVVECRGFDRVGSWSFVERWVRGWVKEFEMAFTRQDCRRWIKDFSLAYGMDRWTRMGKGRLSDEID